MHFLMPTTILFIKQCINDRNNGIGGERKYFLETPIKVDKVHVNIFHKLCYNFELIGNKSKWEAVSVYHVVFEEFFTFYTRQIKEKYDNLIDCFYIYNCCVFVCV